jgi:hypothetical protein
MSRVDRSARPARGGAVGGGRSRCAAGGVQDATGKTAAARDAAGAGVHVGAGWRTAAGASGSAGISADPARGAHGRGQHGIAVASAFVAGLAGLAR